MAMHWPVVGKPLVVMLLLTELSYCLLISSSAEAGWPLSWLRGSAALVGVGIPRPANFPGTAMDDINRFRARYRLRPLRLDTRLSLAASRHARFMARTGLLEHILPNGSNPGSRAMQAGYDWGGIAENIAEGFEAPSEVVRAWIKSPAHRRHLLDPAMTDAGIGEANGFWALTLAHP
jgi:hypothetical protein